MTTTTIQTTNGPRDVKSYGVAIGCAITPWQNGGSVRGCYTLTHILTGAKITPYPLPLNKARALLKRLGDDKALAATGFAAFAVPESQAGPLKAQYRKAKRIVVKHLTEL